MRHHAGLGRTGAGSRRRILSGLVKTDVAAGDPAQDRAAAESRAITPMAGKSKFCNSAETRPSHHNSRVPVASTSEHMADRWEWQPHQRPRGLNEVPGRFETNSTHRLDCGGAVRQSELTVEREPRFRSTLRLPPGLTTRDRAPRQCQPATHSSNFGLNPKRPAAVPLSGGVHFRGRTKPTRRRCA